MTEFQHIVQVYKDQVFNTCLGMVKNFQDAEDLAQEVFIEIYNNYSQFKGNSTLKTWIYRIAVNKSLEYIRSQQAIKRNGKMVDVSHIGKVLEPATFDHPGVKIENKELARILFAAMDQLPENQRIAFTLHKVENLQQEEVAAILDKSRSSVESLIHRAKINLRKTLKAYYENQ